MRVLALDTATEACSVALSTDDGVIGVFREVGRGHAEEILGMVDAILAQAGLTVGRLDTIAVSVGPGAFTGVRICVSVAQGLAFGAGLPVVAVTTLEALALQAIRGGAHQVLACLDARMAEVYWGCFRAATTVIATTTATEDMADTAERGMALGGLTPVGPLAVSSAASVSVPFTGIYHGIGRGFAAYPALASRSGVVLRPGAREALPDARHMAELGASRFREGQAMDPADLQPQYLRDNVAQTELERAAARAAPLPATDLPDAGNMTVP